MLQLESQLHYPFGDTLPAPATLQGIAPGIFWLRMGLPFALDHINLWLLRDCIGGQDGWTIVDCGIDAPETRAHWEQLFAQALDGLPVLRVVVTHMHPDHIGLAHWLCDRWKAPLWMSATDFYVAKAACAGYDGVSGGSPEALAFFHAHGLSEPDLVQQLIDRRGYYKNLVPTVPTQFTRLMDGATIRIGTREWRCISGFGHAPEHIALHAEASGILIAGDMLLPRISTNVSVYFEEPEANSLQLFLDSIRKLGELPPDTLVLPSHGRPFIGAPIRAAQLVEHHRQQLDTLLQFCEADGRSAMDAIPVLFKRKLDFHQLTFALGESIAHWHALWHSGRVQRVRDTHGVWRFQALK